MTNKQEYLLSDTEAEILFSDVRVLDKIEDLADLHINNIIENRIETEVDDDSAFATQILVFRATDKHKKTYTYIYLSDISAWGGYEICQGSAIKVRKVGDKNQVYWDVKKQLETGYYYSGFHLEAMKTAAKWGIVRYGIIPIAEARLKEIEDNQKINQIASLKKQIDEAQKQLRELDKQAEGK